MIYIYNAIGNNTKLKYLNYMLKIDIPSNSPLPLSFILLLHHVESMLYFELLFCSRLRDLAARVYYEKLLPP